MVKKQTLYLPIVSDTVHCDYYSIDDKVNAETEQRFNFIYFQFTGSIKPFLCTAGSNRSTNVLNSPAIMSGPSLWPLNEIHYDFMAGWADF